MIRASRPGGSRQKAIGIEAQLNSIHGCLRNIRYCGLPIGADRAREIDNPSL